MSLDTVPDEPRQSLEKSEIHDILRNDRRRRIIQYLRETDHIVTVNDLSERIASIESGESPAPRNVRKSVYVSLHQTHLPKLDEWDVIEYDDQSKEVVLQDTAQEVEVFMEVVPVGDIPWENYYLGLGLLATVTLLAAKLGVAPVSELGVEFWAWFYILLFTLSSLYHTWQSTSQKVRL